MTPEERYIENEELVYYILGRYYPWLRYDEDACQVCRMGLWQACVKFDESEGAKFATFGCRLILHEIQTYIRDSLRMKRVINRDALSISHEYGEGATIGDLLVGDSEVAWMDIDGFLKALTPEELKVVVGFYNGLNGPQIAQLTGLDRHRVYLARGRARKKWHEYI